MKRITGMMFLTAVVVAAGGRQGLRAQTCSDEDGMFKSSLQAVSDLVDTVKKESVDSFDRAYHQKNFLSKVTFALSVIDVPIDCLNKAAADSATPKDQATADKAKADAYAKLKARLEEYKTHVKAATAAKDAKGIIEKANLSAST